MYLFSKYAKARAHSPCLFCQYLQTEVKDRPFNLKGEGGGLWFFVSFRNFFSDSTRVRIFIFFVAQSANFFSRIHLYVI